MADGIWTLVEKLAKKTYAGKLDWQRTAEDDVYQVAFPGYAVRLFTRHGSQGGLDIIVQVLDQNGTLVEEITDVDIPNSTQLDPIEAFGYMNDLYKAARRKAMGVDAALKSIIESLDREENDDDAPF
ncbi:MAG TPA: hypothetical protein VN622_14285 [Clostridia bacterium]|nr:hypothetical protein [Clostridia bacterium]